MARFKLSEIFSTFVNKHVVAAVPDEMSLCLACHVTQCSSEEFANCPNRRANAAALKALRTANEPDAECANPT